MILDASGRPAQPTQKHEMIEDVKSFSYDLNIKKADGSPAYESARFFQSRKYRCMPEDQAEASREAFEWCFAEVTKDIRIFNERRVRKSAQRSNAA